MFHGLWNMDTFSRLTRPTFLNVEWDFSYPMCLISHDMTAKTFWFVPGRSGYLVLWCKIKFILTFVICKPVHELCRIVGIQRKLAMQAPISPTNPVHRRPIGLWFTINMEMM